MNKRIRNSVVVLLAAILLTGCGNVIPKLSGQEQELVVEYAAGVLLKYDKNHETKLVELTLEQEDDAADPAPEENAPDRNDVDEPESMAGEIEEEDPIDVAVIDNTQASIESFLNLDPIKITYAGYETDDFYPNQGDDLYFIMKASEGNKLLVLKFIAENTSGMEAEIDIEQNKTRFKIAVNGEQMNALQTALLNDMPYYKGTLAPGESTELVLICEIPTEQAGAISTLEVILKSVDDIATISLN